MISSVTFFLYLASLFAVSLLQQCDQTLTKTVANFLIPQATEGYKDTSVLPDVEDKGGFLGVGRIVSFKKGRISGLNDVTGNGVVEVKADPYPESPVKVSFEVQFKKLQVTYEYEVSHLFTGSKGKVIATLGKKHALRLNLVFKDNYCGLDFKALAFDLVLGDFDVKASSKKDLDQVKKAFESVKTAVKRLIQQRLITMVKDLQSFCFLKPFDDLSSEQ